MSHFIFTQRTTISNLQSHSGVEQVPGSGEGPLGTPGAAAVHYLTVSNHVSRGVLCSSPVCNYNAEHLKRRSFAGITGLTVVLMRVGNHSSRWPGR